MSEHAMTTNLPDPKDRKTWMGLLATAAPARLLALMPATIAVAVGAESEVC